MSKKYTLALLAALFLFPLLVLGTANAAKKKEETFKAGDPRYKEVTLRNLSDLYWAMNRVDLKNDDHIDNYLLINECDIYTDYLHNEFQWREIRKTARESLQSRIKTISPRMKFVQPLKLGDYNAQKEGFDIVRSDRIHQIRRFEIKTIDFKKDTCTINHQHVLAGYPKGIMAELSRPIDLEVLPMRSDVAQEYIRRKTIELDNASHFLKRRESIEESRKVYIVMFVRFFSSVGEHYSEKENQNFAKLLGILEKIEVYDDLQLTKLLYKQNYTRSKRNRPHVEKKEMPKEEPKETTKTQPALSEPSPPVALEKVPEAVPVKTP